MNRYRLIPYSPNLVIFFIESRTLFPIYLSALLLVIGLFVAGVLFLILGSVLGI